MGNLSIRLRIEDIDQSQASSALNQWDTAMANLASASGKTINVEYKRWEDG